MPTDALTRQRNVQRGIALEYLTIGWNLLECLVAVAAGLIAGSVALVGFGVDSAIESVSGSVLLWRLHAEGRGRHVETIDRTALKMVGVSFFLLAAYMAYDSAVTPVRREKPDQSLIGIGLAIVSLIAMPLLARAKRKAAANLNSAALQARLWAGGGQTRYAALLMVPIIANEGRAAIKGEACADCH